MPHEYVIPSDVWKSRKNPEIWITVSSKKTRESSDQWVRFVPTSLSVFVEATSNETLWFVTDRQGTSARNLSIRNAQTNEPIRLTPKKP
jgi:hypothetical protein